MIAGTYILSGVLLLVTGYLFEQHQLNATTLTVVVVGRVLLRLGRGQRRIPDGVGDLPAGDAGACIALFYAVGTGVGGIIGPQLFAPMIATGKASEVFKALAIGAVLMIVGGIDRDRVRRQRRAARAGDNRQAAHRGRGRRTGRRGPRRLRRAAALVLRHPTVRDELVLASRLARRIWDGRSRGVVHPGYVRGLARIRRCAGIGVDRHGWLVRRRGCGGLLRLRDLHVQARAYRSSSSQSMSSGSPTRAVCAETEVKLRKLLRGRPSVPRPRRRRGCDRCRRETTFCPGFKLEALAVEGDLDAIGLERDLLADRRTRRQSGARSDQRGVVRARRIS